MTRDANESIVHVADPGVAVDAIRSAGRRVVTFAGFSGGGYEDPLAVERLVADYLAQLDPSTTLVCAGATPDGIGVVYALAAARGFETIGIVSSVAQDEGVRFADGVGKIYVVDDDEWGGRRSDGTLSPTSAAMVGASDEIIAIGGGAIARDEVEAARELGKTVRYAAAQMHHATAIDKAKRKGESPPTDFNGPVHGLMGPD